MSEQHPVDQAAPLPDDTDTTTADSSPARRAAAHTAILNLLTQHHPDAADTTTHGGTGEPRALNDAAAAYTDAAINALTGGV